MYRFYPQLGICRICSHLCALLSRPRLERYGLCVTVGLKGHNVYSILLLKVMLFILEVCITLFSVVLNVFCILTCFYPNPDNPWLKTQYERGDRNLNKNCITFCITDFLVVTNQN